MQSESVVMQVQYSTAIKKLVCEGKHEKTIVIMSGKTTLPEELESMNFKNNLLYTMMNVAVT